MTLGCCNGSWSETRIHTQSRCLLRAVHLSHDTVCCARCSAQSSHQATDQRLDQLFCAIIRAHARQCANRFCDKHCTTVATNTAPLLRQTLLQKSPVLCIQFSTVLASSAPPSQSALQEEEMTMQMQHMREGSAQREATMIGKLERIKKKAAKRVRLSRRPSAPLAPNAPSALSTVHLSYLLSCVWPISLLLAALL